MQLKSTKAVTVNVDSDGKICIQQYYEVTDSIVAIYLTPEQFNSIESWVFKNRDEIELNWNNGVNDETDS
jgi:hypothetical protein